MLDSLGIDDIRMIAMIFGGLVLVLALVGMLYLVLSSQKDKKAAKLGILPGPNRNQVEEEQESQPATPKFSFDSAVGASAPVKIEEEPSKKPGLFSRKARREDSSIGTQTQFQQETTNGSSGLPVNQRAQEQPPAPVAQPTPPPAPVAQPTPPPAPVAQPTPPPARTAPKLVNPRKTVFQDSDDDADW